MLTRERQASSCEISRPLRSKRNLQERCGPWSGADMCAAFDAAHTPQARMGDAMGRAAKNRHHRRSAKPTECPMPELNDQSRSHTVLKQDSTLIAVLEMSQSAWLVARALLGSSSDTRSKRSSQMRLRYCACCGVGRRRPPRQATPSRASPSRLKPVAMASGWPAGYAPTASKPMSSTRPASLSRASTGGLKQIGWIPRC